MSNRCANVGLVALLSLSGCSADASEDEPDFDYGRDEMKEAIEGAWEGTMTPADGGAASPVTMTLVYGAPQTRPLCGNRFLSSGLVGPRCVDISSINVTGTLTSRPAEPESSRDVPVRGTFEVWSLRFTGRGELMADVDDQKLAASVSNGVLEGVLQTADGNPQSSFSLRRR